MLKFGMSAIITELEKKIAAAQDEIRKYSGKFLSPQIGLRDAAEALENILSAIPVLREMKELLKLETSLEAYSEKLSANGVDKKLVDFIAAQRRKKIALRKQLTLGQIAETEKKLGLFKKSASDVFSLKSHLSRGSDIDEMEVMARKMRAHLEVESALKRKIMKEDTVIEFAEDAGFEEKNSVAELLAQEKISAAMKQQIVTEEILEQKLARMEGQMSKFQKELLKYVAGREKKFKESISRDAPFAVRTFCDYVVNPVSWTFGVMGVLIITLFSLEKFLFALIHAPFPVFTAFLSSTGIFTVLEGLAPGAVFLTGFSFVLVAGLVKKLDRHLKNQSR